MLASLGQAQARSSASAGPTKMMPTPSSATPPSSIGEGGARREVPGCGAAPPGVGAEGGEGAAPRRSTRSSSPCSASSRTSRCASSSASPWAPWSLWPTTSITVGALSVANREMSLVTIAALLTIVGYSVMDTIVVYDRIRENMRVPGREPSTGPEQEHESGARPDDHHVGHRARNPRSCSWSSGGKVLWDFAFALTVGRDGGGPTRRSYRRAARVQCGTPLAATREGSTPTGCDGRLVVEAARESEPLRSERLRPRPAPSAQGPPEPQIPQSLRLARWPSHASGSIILMSRGPPGRPRSAASKEACLLRARSLAPCSCSWQPRRTQTPTPTRTPSGSTLDPGTSRAPSFRWRRRPARSAVFAAVEKAWAGEDVDTAWWRSWTGRPRPHRDGGVPDRAAAGSTATRPAS